MSVPPPRGERTLSRRATKIFVTAALLLAIGFGLLMVWTILRTSSDPQIQEEVERIRDQLEAAEDTASTPAPSDSLR